MSDAPTGPETGSATPPSGGPSGSAASGPQAPQPAADPGTEPTQPVPNAYWQQPYGRPYEQSYPQTYPQTAYQAYPSQPAQRPGLPGWTWPLVAGLALVLGIVGGALGAGLVQGQESGGDTPGGVLEVEQRTAPPLPANNRSIATVAGQVLPSTVQILAEYDGEERGAAGSGFVFDKRGHVITNNHVVAEAADGGFIEVIDHDGRRMKAKVVGRSTVYDLAVLDVEGAERLKPASIGSSQQMRVGETVVAFGSPLGLSATVTSGIVSAFDRPVTTGDGQDSSYINAVQTDAAINPGNSGGPLVNMQGQVIGVNSAIASLGGTITDQDGGNIGVGFAIPIEQVLVTTDQILKTGKAKYPVIGANVRGTKALDGARVIEITDGSPAEEAKLRIGDVITAVDGTPVTGSIDVVVAIRTHQPGEKVTLTIRRDGKVQKVTVGLDGRVG